MPLELPRHHKERPRRPQETSRAPARMPKTRPGALQTSPDIQQKPCFSIGFSRFLSPDGFGQHPGKSLHTFAFRDTSKTSRRAPNTHTRALKTSPRDLQMLRRPHPKQPRGLQEPSKRTPGLPKNLIFPWTFQEFLIFEALNASWHLLGPF